MRESLAYYCILTAQILVLVNSTGVSSKLDFGDGDQPKKIIINSEDLKLEDYKADDNSATTVVCLNGGCNKTEVKNDEILTDIVVHVKTSQNVAKTNKTIEETPDVPIVVGYGGVTQKPFISDSLISNPSTVTNLDQNAFYPSSFNSYNHHHHRTHPHPSFQRKNTPDYDQVSYENLFIPILPTFHKQYFGEQPPQQYVWYPKGGASYNPVEFKRFERPVAWNQVQYSRPTQFGNSAHVTTPGYTTCTCQNPGLNWYPTTPSWNIPNQRSDGIDDKLSELN